MIDIFLIILLQDTFDWTVSKTDEVEKVLREQVAFKIRGVRRVVVRFSPSENEQAAFEDEFVSLRLSESEPEDSDHEHQHGHEHTNGHTNATNASASRKRK